MKLSDLPNRVRVQIEVSKGGRIKRNHTGGIDFVSPLPCPFNYGSIPDTLSDDGEPLDVVVLGGRLPLGHSGDYRVVGWVDFVDGGISDPKVVCIQTRLAPADRQELIDFFARYAKLKRPLNRLRLKRGPTLFKGFQERLLTPETKTP
jgi:inorganic pyrophosphatase